MAMNDTLASAMSNIINAEKIGKNICKIKPFSKITKAVLDIMQTNKYVGSYEIVEEGRTHSIKLNLLGAVNDCGVIKPRFSVTKAEFDKFEKRYLPAKGFGLIVLSTSKGIMTLEEAKQKGLGGKLLAYVY